MKLLTKTQIYYISLLLVLLIVWSGIFLFAISFVLKSSIDETLYSELENTNTHFQEEGAVYFMDYAGNSPILDYRYIDSIRTDEPFYSDTLLYNSVEQELIPYREIHAETMADGRPVRITIRKSMIEYDDLFTAILFTEMILIMLLIAGMIVLNRSILEKIWQPFLDTLNKASDYRINQKEPLTLPETDINEFRQLNTVLKEMMNKIEYDYQSLKQFTENASHEIQTPLSVISARIEMLLQEEEFGEQQWKLLKDVYEAANQLSRLNKALLLLTKIENRQFEEHKEVEISVMLSELITEFEEQFKQKELKLRKEIRSRITVSANSQLIEIMLRNLLINAIRHNREEGEVFLALDENKLSISNTGKALDEAPSMYFERFQKGSSNSNSLGLGLAIVYSICELYGFDINYKYKEPYHKITVIF